MYFSIVHQEKTYLEKGPLLKLCQRDVSPEIAYLDRKGHTIFQTMDQKFEDLISYFVLQNCLKRVKANPMALNTEINKTLTAIQEKRRKEKRRGEKRREGPGKKKREEKRRKEKRREEKRREWKRREEKRREKKRR